MWCRHLVAGKMLGLFGILPQSRQASVISNFRENDASDLARQLSVLKELYREANTEALTQRARAAWLHELAKALARPPKGWRRWLPYELWSRRVLRRLAAENIFDGADYMSRYPDVRLDGQNPVYHYLAHGIGEGRDAGGRLSTCAHIDPDLSAIPEILASRLFDANWYAERYGVTGSERDLAEDFLRASAADALRQPGPLFSGSFYSLENPDIREINPLVHYLRYGMQQGRRAFQSATADAFMTDASDQPIHTIYDLLEPGRPVVVLHWKDGNFFFTDIAKYISEVLNSQGYRVILRDDHRNIDLRSVEIIVVAPHEYCVHGPGVEFTPQVAGRIVYVNLEQWHTSWFSLALDKMLKSRKALDINPLSARGLSRLGIKAGFLPLLPAKGGVFDLGQAPPSRQLTQLRAIKPLTYPRDILKRPYDILFVGYLNERRARALADLGHALSGFDCFLHAPRFNGPVTTENPNMIGGRDVAQIAQHAKLLLNIHQGESHYFEWHRLVISGIAQGCIPLTEPCADIGIVKPGEHYIEAAIEEMPARIEWLLSTSEGQMEIKRLHKNGQVLMARLQKQFAGRAL
ncbi:hypothetical protein NSU_4816 [Novosphingobium pentaromativorans US6-1]|uniref:Uncharacterized protein n=2 Tax=Novosphingobium pentaromativorans TaxID=205844 RepID=G6EKE5_9SPHN|nr:hypothetical protein NSU_4816 [Novosphingobium pentaromativorans US6-1]